MLLVENSLHTTGAFVAAIGMLNALRADYDIEFVLPTTSTLRQRIEAYGIFCHSLPMSELGRSWTRLLRYIPFLLINNVHLRRILSQRNIDILVMNDYYNLLGVMAKCTGWRGQLLTFVRLMPHKQHRLLNQVWTALGIRFSDKVIAVSQAVANQLPKGPKLQVLYDPYCIEGCFSEKSVENESGIVSCLYLANYIEGKGHLHGLQAFAWAFNQNPALRLRFVGGDMGLEKNRALRASLELAVEKMGLGHVVIFDGYSNDVERDIKESDIVLNFSESESFSYTCLEASAYGRPIIATRSGGPEEIVDDGISGLLIPVGNVEAMGSALLLLSRDRAKRVMMGLAGRRIVQERFSEHRFVDDWRRLFAVNS